MKTESFSPRVRELDYALSSTKGGTSSMSVSRAITKNGWLKASVLGEVGGVAELNNSAKLPVESLPQGVEGLRSIMVGPNNIAYGLTSNTFKITNYDSFTAYTVTATSGTVSIDGDTITYIPVNENGTGGFSVNGEYFPITVVARRPETPTITSPVNGSTGLGNSVSLTSSTFVMNGASDTHQSSHWQISASPTFASVIAEVIDSTTNMTTWTYTPLNPASQYYARVRYKGNSYGYSNWSTPVTFTTKSSFIPTSEQKRFTQNPASIDNDFGCSVAISDNGNTVAIGAQRKSVKFGVGEGVVFVFVRSGTTWTQQAMLSAGDIYGALFGSAVAISADGNTLAVGAYFNNYPGYVYVYVRTGSTWTQQAKLTGSDSASYDYFGKGVTLSADGNRLAAGAPRHGGYGNGAVYIYNRSGTTWTQVKKYMAPDNSYNSFFGEALSISGDGTVLAVAAPNQLSTAGAFYVFRLVSGTWDAGVKVKPAEIVSPDRFGTSICISRDKSTIIVGAPGQATNRGASYIFAYESNAWVQKNKTIGGAANVNHGTCVHLSSDGSIALVGTPQYGTSGNGNTWVLTRSGSTWTFQSALVASDGAPGDRFGWAVAISADGSTICIGAYPKNTATGAAYAFV